MKVLVPVDDSVGSSNAVQTVAELLSRGDHEITLFHVTEKLPQFVISEAELRSEGNPFATVVSEWQVAKTREGERLLDQYAAILAESGISQDRIRRKLENVEALPEARRMADARAIIQEMNSGNYEIIVLGRREVPKLFPFLGSVSQAVINEGAGHTIWVVDKK